jgi:hypothetical protein
MMVATHLSSRINLEAGKYMVSRWFAQFRLRALFVVTLVICVGLVKRHGLLRPNSLKPSASFIRVRESSPALTRVYRVSFVSTDVVGECQEDLYIDCSPYGALDECITYVNDASKTRHYSDAVSGGNTTSSGVQVPTALMNDRFHRLHKAFEICREQYAGHPDNRGEKLTELELSMEDAPLIMNSFRVTDGDGNPLQD